MSEGNISQEIKLKTIDEIRNYLIEEVNKNELISKKYKNVYRILNYIEHLLILISTVARCISFTAFASLVGIPTIQASAIELKICVMTGGIKKHKSLRKKN